MRLLQRPFHPRISKAPDHSKSLILEIQAHADCDPDHKYYCFIGQNTLTDYLSAAIRRGDSGSNWTGPGSHIVGNRKAHRRGAEAPEKNAG